MPDGSIGLHALVPTVAATALPTAPAPACRLSAHLASTSDRLITNSRLRTQTVTAGDLRVGKIRIPHATKRVFPEDKATIEIELCGEMLTSRWDPKFGPDRERSGTVAVPREQLARLVRAGRELTVTIADGVIRIGGSDGRSQGGARLDRQSPSS